MEQQIIALLKRCSAAYARGEFYKLSAEDAALIGEYQEGMEVQDLIYDYLYYKYKEQFPNNEFFYKVGKSDAGYGEEVDLSRWPAGSMEEIKEGELNKWKINQPYFISAKLDGCSLVLFYKNGHLEKASTRGDGLKGFDVTRHIWNISCIPHQLADSDEDLIVRGELIIPTDLWPQCKKDLEEHFGKSFANARNTIAGFLNSKTTNMVILKYARFLAYADNHEGIDEDMKFWELNDYGFETPYAAMYLPEEFDEETLQKYIKFLKEGYNFECDGVILTVNDHSVLPGYETNTLNPKRSRKYKVGMADDAKETTVTAVRWQISKDGLLKPVLEIDPIQLDGATVSNVTANNYSTIKTLGLGIGARIKVKRSGMVIPYLEEVVQQAPVISEPDIPFILSETGVEAVYDGDDPEILFEIYLQKLVFATKALDIDQAAEGNLRKIAQDFYNITDTYMTFLDLVKADEDTIVSIIGKNGKKLYKSLHERIKSITEPELFDALGTFGRLIGKTKLQKIYDVFGHLAPSYEELIQVEGFAETTARQVVNHRVDYEIVKKTLETLDQIKLAEAVKVEPKSTKYADYNVCFTGVRSERLVDIINSNGGHASDNWTKAVNLLIAKDPTSTSGKAKKAREKGIRIISLQEAEQIFVD